MVRVDELLDCRMEKAGRKCNLPPVISDVAFLEVKLVKKCLAIKQMIKRF